MTIRKSKVNDCFYVQSNKNYDVLCLADKVGWKRAQKIKGMIARKLDSDCVVDSIEGPLNAKAGQFVCRGIDTDDWWVQKKDAIDKKYHFKGAWPKPVVFNNNQYTDFGLYEPKPDRAVLVCRMPQTFIVYASWGTLKGKKHDYLVKPLEDELNPDPQDVWLVDAKLFHATYVVKWFLHWF